MKYGIEVLIKIIALILSLYMFVLFIPILSFSYGGTLLGVVALPICASAELGVLKALFRGERSLLVSVATEAAEKYKQDSVIPYRTASTGVQAGIATWFKRDWASTPGDFVSKLTNCWINYSAVNLVIAHLKQSDSLWKKGGNPHVYLNTFLRELRVRDVDLYKYIIGKAFSIKFITNGSQTFYRRDRRNSRTIFEGGFGLQEGIIINPNAAAIPKTKHTGQESLEGWTENHGVSTSKVVPPKWYGRHDKDKLNWSKKSKKYDKPDRYYTIFLPSYHNLLLIDVTNSPCNKGNLRKKPHRRALQEVNSMDSIPKQYIYSRNKEECFFSSRRSWGNRGTKNKTNPNYDKSYHVEPAKLPPRGNY